MLPTDRTSHITATPRATDMLGRLVLRHGPLALFQSGGCCDGSLPLCLLASDMAPGPGDLLLGNVVGVPFYIDAEQYDRWKRQRVLCSTWPAAPRRTSRLGRHTPTS